jgi:hypothetical protein
VQYGVDGTTPPPMSSALRGYWRNAITPGDFAKSIMLSAVSCWSQTPPVEVSALRPSTLAHGWPVKMSPPLAS